MGTFRIHVCATFTAEPVGESLEFLLDLLQVPAQVEFAPFNQVFQELLNPGSDLAQNTGGANLLLVRLEDLDGGTSGSQGLTSNGLELGKALRTAVERFRVPTLLAFCPPSGKALAAADTRALLAEVEARLTSLARDLKGLYVISSKELSALCSVEEYDYPRGQALGAVPYTQTFYNLLGQRLARTLYRLAAPPHKVVVLDCDQTLWKGVAGEDGPLGVELDAPRRFLQEFMREQSAAGMVLCLCSKNNEADVWEVFEQRPEMPLRREHIVAWRINWERKSENIKSLALELQLGLDSFIFVDDDPVVCAEVRAGCPDVLTLQLPEDVTRIPDYFRHHWAFDHLEVTEEDKKRSEMYRANADRTRLLESTTSLEDFLSSLGLECTFAAPTPDQLARVAQLTQRTNQFNANPIRRSEAELQQLLGDGAKCIAAQVSDRFGDYGLVGVVIYHERDTCLEVDTFLMSCRVLGRGVEHRMLSALGQLAVEGERGYVSVRFTTTEKNLPARTFLEDTGKDFQEATESGFVFRYPAPIALEATFAPGAAPVSSSSPPPPPSPEGKRDAPDPAVEQGVRWSARADGLHRIASELHRPDAFMACLEPEEAARPGLGAAYLAPRTETEAALVEIWQRVLKVSPIGVLDDYFELGGDSLLGVYLFGEIEEQLGHTLPLATLLSSPTVSALARCIEEGGPAREWRHLVPIQAGDARPPLFCLHAAGGNVLFYRDLARHLGPDQPVYGLQARESLETGTYLDQVEEMAAEYLKEIRELQPEGPYFLCGSSFGGLLAYEAAQQLHAESQGVALLALFDTYGPGYPKKLPGSDGAKGSDWTQRLQSLKTQFERVPPGDRWTFLKSRAAKLVKKGRRRWLWKKNQFQRQYAKALGRELPKDLQRNHKAIQRALERYAPQPCGVELTLFRASEQPAGIVPDPFLGWHDLAVAGLRVIESAGAHGAMTVDPYAEELAQRMSLLLHEHEHGTAGPESHVDRDASSVRSAPS